MSRSRRTRSSTLATALAAGLLAAASPASAGTATPAAEPAAQPPVAAVASEAPTCGDPAAERAQRDAALAALGRRLAAEAKGPGSAGINRSGHNYGEARATAPAPQPPAKPAPTP